MLWQFGYDICIFNIGKKFLSIAIPEPSSLSVKVKTLLKDLYHLFEQCMCRLEVVIHPQCDCDDE